MASSESNRRVVSELLQRLFVHRGTFAGVPPTERRIEYGAMRFYRIGGGRVVASWAVQDRLGLFQQLGLVPDGLGGVNWAAGSSQRR
jgi:predicted ester cyclase